MVLSRLGKVAYLTLYGNAHTTRQCKSARHAVHLAESAFDTLIGAFYLFDGFLGRRALGIHQIVSSIRHTVEVEIQHWQWFQTLDKAIGIIVEDDALVQQAMGVEDGLEFFHHFIGLLAPFILHKRSHIPACSVFSLQRAIVALYDQFCHLSHHLCVSCHLVLVGKALVQYKVVVSFERMPIDTSV